MKNLTLGRPSHVVVVVVVVVVFVVVVVGAMMKGPQMKTLRVLLQLNSVRPYPLCILEATRYSPRT